MEIYNDWLQHFTSATETPFGFSLARMIIILCVGMLVVAIIGMLAGRWSTNSYASNQWWDNDGLTYYNHNDSSESWSDWGSSSWFSGDDTGSGGGDGDWFDND